MRWGKEAESLLIALESAARTADSGVLGEWSSTLSSLPSSDLLLLDRHARSAPYWAVAIVGDAKTWGAVSLDEPSAVRAVVASWHRSGYLRERATMALRRSDSPLAMRALALRAMDPVAEVRNAARTAILRRLDESAFVDVIDVIDVIASGDRGRWGDDAKRWAETWIFDSSHVRDRVEACLASQRIAARRWALSWGLTRNLISPSRLTEIAMGDPDQWMPPRAAAFLIDADPGSAAGLSLSRSAAVRLLSAGAAREGDANAAWFSELCADRSARVRRFARGRARQYGVGFAESDWAALTSGLPTWAVRAALADVSAQSTQDVTDIAAGLLAHPAARVRADAALAIARAWPASRAAPVLAAMLEDESAAVARTVAQVLGRIRAPAAIADPAWASSRATSRRSAWMFVSRLGAWDALEGHLRALVDDDGDVKSLGERGVEVWMRDVAPRAWTHPSESQRRRILHLVAVAVPHERLAQQITFGLGSGTG